MIDFEVLLPDVLQSLYNEGVDESSFNKNRALYAIKQSYREFIRRSRVLRRDFVITGQAGVHEYPLSTIDGEAINKIYSVSTELCCYNLGGLCTCNCCPCTYAYHQGVLCLCPAPECDGEEIVVCAAVHPSHDVCGMDEFIYERYAHAIASGATHRLLSKKESLNYQVEYDAGIASANREASNMWSRRNHTKKRRWVRR